MSVSAQIRIRRDTAANFTSANPTLALGEIAYETDTKRFKVGTGTTAWTSLGYAAQNPTSLTITDTTDSTTKDNGALVVEGGVGIEKALNVGGNATIAGIPVGKGTAAAPASNIAIGSSAGASLLSGGTYNVLTGDSAGFSITDGDNNIASGYAALASVTGGGSNIGIGAYAGYRINTGSNNLHIGTDSGAFGDNASNCVGLGYQAMMRNRTNDNVAVGTFALREGTLGSANVAVGRSALRAATTAVATVTTTVAGTGGTDGAKTAVQLERDSGETMVTYPTVGLTVTSGAVAGTVTVVTGGSAATTSAAGGIIFRANAAGIAAGVPADWRCQLQTVVTAVSNTAVGHQAGLLQTTASENTLVGSRIGDAITTGSGNTGVGSDAISSLTTGSQNTALGRQALLGVTTGSENVAVGNGANQQGNPNAIIAIGWASFLSCTGTRSVAIGHSAGRFRGSGTDSLTSATDSVLIGFQSRAAGDSQTNQVVIGGTDAVGDGSNTTVLGNSSTTSTRMAGTATSVLRVSGDTVRIDNARTPATAGAAGNAGDICWDADYIYVCVAANTWKRVAIATWP